MEQRAVVTAFLRHEGKILLLRRSDKVGTYRGKWSGISGYLEARPLTQALTEINEETGISQDDVTLVARGAVLHIPDRERGIEWEVHPFLFDVAAPSRIRLDWENTELRWIRPDEIDRYPTVPALEKTLEACLSAIAAASAGASPELLAPAGTIEAGLTALDCGADAVYAGLARFNARERGRNFTLDEMGKLVTYARGRGKRVYVALNTLIKERELPEVAEILSELTLIAPHAVIVQDLGLVRLMREHFPSLGIHASTQMGAHNSADVRFLQRLGVTRVILQRQVTIEELECICANSEIEVEVFVHGALCCSQSGRCLLSSWLGGWSGNRGKCKQPCRRRYFSNKGNGFFFSTKDLCLIDVVPTLRQVGVAALKIEGRLRDPDYVRRTVTAYRMILDASEAGQRETLKEAKNLLAGSLGRKWSHGFWTRAEFEDVIEHRALGSSGRLIGKVVRTEEAGCAVALQRELRKGDRIRIQPQSGEEGPALVVTRMSIGKRAAARATRGQTCFVHCDKAVPADGLVYQIGVEPPDMQARIARLPVCRANVLLAVSVCASGVEVAVRNCSLQPWHHAVSLEPSRQRALTAEQVSEEFRKSGSRDFMAAGVDVRLEPGLFMPLSRLKAIRREFWQWLAARVSESELEQHAACTLDELQRELKLTSATDCREPATTTIRVAPGTAAEQVSAEFAAGSGPAPIIARDFGDIAAGADEVVLPAFCPEDELDELAAGVQELVRRGFRRFRVTSWAGLEMLRGARDLVVTASLPLPVTNSCALKELVENGVARGTAWIELEKDALHDLLERAPGGIELLTYGRIPLLETRAELPLTGTVRDGRGTAFLVTREQGLTRIYPAEVLAIPPAEGVSEYIDLKHASRGETETHKFNYDFDLV